METRLLAWGKTTYKFASTPRRPTSALLHTTVSLHSEADVRLQPRGKD